MLLRSSCVALAGLKRTPRKASGISSGMMMALKISADFPALFGLDRFMTFSAAICGIVAANSSRQDGEILGHVVGQREGGQRAA